MFDHGGILILPKLHGRGVILAIYLACVVLLGISGYIYYPIHGPVLLCPYAFTTEPIPSTN